MDGAEHHVGKLIRHWRARRQLSQLDLAGEAGVSSRHVSFIETGRTQPSREMVLQLARALDVPLRDRNDLLTAAGFAPIYRMTDLDAPALTLARRALDFILKGQEPYPALVLDRHWNVLKVNDGSSFRSCRVSAPPKPLATSRWSHWTSDAAVGSQLTM